MDPDQVVHCAIFANVQREELLGAANVIIWDEFPSNHRHCFEAAYRALNGLQGKVIVCMGDFRQIGPVVKGGSGYDVIHACISFVGEVSTKSY